MLHKANCPVLTVPAHAPDAVPAAPVVFTRILFPIDFSDSSMYALNYAMSLAQEADARLTVLHVMVCNLEAEAPEILMFFGSTTQHVVRQATRPVLTLRKG